MPKHNDIQPNTIRQTFLPTHLNAYNIYISHKHFDEFTALYDWRAKAYSVAELLALPIRMRTQADCTLEISLLEDAGMIKIEHGIDIKLYERPTERISAYNQNQHIPEGFDYAELRVAINRIVHEIE